MEADWEAEIGADLPEIVVPWKGFVDLRHRPAAEIEEASNYRALAEALTALNQPDSPVFTSKCDLWALSEEEIDPLEFDAGSADGRRGMACYIDLLHRSPQVFASFAMMEAWARRLTAVLGSARVRQGRLDMVIRSAQINGSDGFGVTLYAAGCGPDESSAETSWKAVLYAAVAATISHELPAGE